MKNVFQALIFSTVASVMFSCSSSDTESINLPDELLQKGKLQVNVMSGVAESGTKPDVDINVNHENTIKNLHFFVFKNKEGQSDNGAKEHYEKKDFTEESISEVFSSEPTQGHKDFVLIANLNKEEIANVGTITELYTHRALLSTQSIGNFTMVGEQRFEVKGGLNETTVNLSRLVAKVVLKSVTVDADPNVYGTIEVERAFMMNVSNESWMRGSGLFVEAGDPVAHGYQEGENYLAALTQPYSPTKSSSFYVFENNGTTDAKTMLVIEADYTKKDGIKEKVYYSIVVKTGDVAKVLRNNVYTLTAAIKRPGSLHPEIPSDHGDLEVSITVDEWIDNAEQGETFE